MKLQSIDTTIDRLGTLIMTCQLVELALTKARHLIAQENNPDAELLHDIVFRLDDVHQDLIRVIIKR
jgi:hypothetical protein